MADTRIQELVINELTKAQYDAAEKDPNQLYMVPDANPDYVGDLSSLLTTAKDNLVNAINELAQGGGGEWELLVDYTVPSTVSQVFIDNGDNGQVFDDYKELLIYGIFQPNGGGTQTISHIGTKRKNNAWSQRYTFGYSTSATATTYAYVRLIKTPIGVISDTLAGSFNSSTLSTTLGYALNNFIMTSALVANQAHPSTEDFFDTHTFERVEIGSYQPIIGAGSRFIICGKK